MLDFIKPLHLKDGRITQQRYFERTSTWLDATWFVSGLWKTDIVSAYQATLAQLLPVTAVTIDFDNLTFETDPDAFTLNPDGSITLNKEDIFEIRYKVAVQKASSNARASAEIFLEADFGVGYQRVAGSTTFTYNRNLDQAEDTVFNESFLNLPVGSRVRVRALKESGNGNIETIPGESFITFRQFEQSNQDFRFAIVCDEWEPSDGNDFDFIFESMEWTP